MFRQISNQQKKLLTRITPEKSWKKKHHDILVWPVTFYIYNDNFNYV